MSEVDQVFVKDFGRLIKQRIAEKQRSLTPQNIVLKNIKNISQARTAGMTWNEIADLLNATIKKKNESDQDFSLSGNLVRFHYQKALERSAEDKPTDLPRTQKRSRQKQGLVSLNELDLHTTHDTNESANESTNGSAHGSEAREKAPDSLNPELSGVSESSTPKKSRFNFNSVRPSN